MKYKSKFFSNAFFFLFSCEKKSFVDKVLSGIEVILRKGKISTQKRDTEA